MRTIPPNLIKAYREAIYKVYTDDQEITFQVGKVSAELVALMTFWGVETAAFMTAFNPFSELLDLQENESRQQKMWAEIEVTCPKVFPGMGQDLLGEWPHEPSLLALGISIEEAERVADRYEQNAFIWTTSEQGLISLKTPYSMVGPTD